MITDGKIVLRAPEPDDLNFLFSIENRVEWWHLSGTVLPFSRFDLEQYILLNDKDIYTQKQARFIVDLKNSPVGIIDLFDFEPLHKRAGIGIIIDEHFRKEGIGKASLNLLIDYSFNILQLHQLYCNIEVDNMASLRLFEKSGFKKVGLKKDWLFINGKFVDEWLLQLINEKI
jgi:diamine N-acetyltransferase